MMQTSNNQIKLWEHPFHPWLVAASSVALLLAHNILEVKIELAARPLLISLIAATTIFLVLAAILKNRHRAALLATLFIILFISYGHLYQFLKETPVLGVTIGRHRYLAPVYGALLVVGLWIVVRRRLDAAKLTPIANLIAAAILIVPAYEIGSHILSLSRASRAVEAATSENGEAFETVPDDSPDVYYIILDAYTRGDALQRDRDYDNSFFLEGLEAMGFYVADCSRSNYDHTLSSLTSSLNGDYVAGLRERLDEFGVSTDDVFVLLKHSLIRGTLESLGYQTVAFQTKFPWSDMQDADIYLTPWNIPLGFQRMTSFESLLVESSVIRILLDASFLLFFRDFGTEQFEHRSKAEIQSYILQELPKIASIRQPTFTFAHVGLPHWPYIFGPEGEIITDPAITNDRNNHVGYTSQVAFVSSQTLSIVQELIKNSEIPPIIVIQGDHGLEKDNRLQILNAYYLPGNGADHLYPTISPVNTFRIILNQYFGANYELLPDYSYSDGDYQTNVPETAPECISNTQ